MKFKVIDRGPEASWPTRYQAYTRIWVFLFPIWLLLGGRSTADEAGDLCTDYFARKQSKDTVVSEFELL